MDPVAAGPLPRCSSLRSYRTLVPTDHQIVEIPGSVLLRDARPEVYPRLTPGNLRHSIAPESSPQTLELLVPSRLQPAVKSRLKCKGHRAGDRFVPGLLPVSK